MRTFEQLAIHFSYNQTFIPLHGALVLVVAPAPSNRDAGQEKYEVNYSKLKAFLVEVGQAAFIDKGVWHNAITPGTECTFINVTRKNPGEGTTQADRTGPRRGGTEKPAVRRVCGLEEARWPGHRTGTLAR